MPVPHLTLSTTALADRPLLELKTKLSILTLQDHSSFSSTNSTASTACGSPTTTTMITPWQNTPLDLPEILSLICQHLDLHSLAACARVNRFWRENAMRFLWHTLDLHQHTFTPCLSNFGRHIRHLTLNGYGREELKEMDFSGLKLQSLRLDSGDQPFALTAEEKQNERLEGKLLQQLLNSSIGKLSTLTLANVAAIDETALTMVASLTRLRHFRLDMVDNSSKAPQNGAHQHHQPQQHQQHQQQQQQQLEEQEQQQHHVLAETDEDPQDQLLPQGQEQQSPAQQAPPKNAVALSSLLGLVRDCLELTKVTVHNATITDSATMLTLQQPSQQHLLPLASLNLDGTILSGAALGSLLGQCPNLAHLALGLSASNDPLILSEFKMPPSSTHFGIKLRSLVLHSCQFLDGHGFTELIQASPGLLKLDANRSNIDDGALSTLGFHCRRLLELDLAGCAQITDQGLRDYLVHDGNCLQTLSLMDCTELTGQGIRAVLQRCGELVHLDFHQPDIMPEAFLRLQEVQDQDLISSLMPTLVVPVVDVVDGQVAVSSVEQATTTVVATVAEPVPEIDHRWACHSTLQVLQIKKLDTMTTEDNTVLRQRLGELTNLKVLCIGGSQLEFSVLESGVTQTLERLMIDSLAKEVDTEQAMFLRDNSPFLTRLWCRQLIRHSEPWKLIREARKSLKLW